MKDLFGVERYGKPLYGVYLSSCERYRYRLSRCWQSRTQRAGDGKVVCFVMLNPSTADHIVDDPTITRCMNYVKAWGHSTLIVRNLFALRATNPKELLKADDPVGEYSNDKELLRCADSDLIIAAWGANVPFGRDREVLEMLKDTKLYCLGKTKDGSPRHPLYMRKTAKPIPFNF